MFFLPRYFPENSSIKKKFCSSREGGAALIAVIFVLLVITVLLTALTSMTTSEALISYNEYQGTQALYLAEGGIQYAIDAFYRNPALMDEVYREGPGFSRELLSYPLTFAEGEIVSILLETTEGGLIKISSEARVKGITKKAVATILGGSIIAFGEGISACICSQTELNTPVIINGDLNDEDACSDSCKSGGKGKGKGNDQIKNIQFNSILAVKGEANTGKNSSVNYRIPFDESLIDAPLQHFPFYEFPAEENKPEKFTAVNPASFEPGGVYLVEGELSITEDIENCTIYVEDDITVRAVLRSVNLLSEGKITVEINPGQHPHLSNCFLLSDGEIEIGEMDRSSHNNLDDVKIYSRGDIETGKHVTFKGTIYTLGTFTGGENIEYTGSILAENIVLKKNSVYNGQITLLEWQETS